MSLKHADIWRAIDRLAAKNGISVSALARRSGLSPTVFNPSKRSLKTRKRWPSTESISRIMQATDTDLDSFISLTVSPSRASKTTVLPLLSYAQAGRDGYFDDAGYPIRNSWDEIRFPDLSDENAFALEVSGKSMEPVFREGNHIVVSPAEKPRRGDRVVVRTRKGDVLVKQLGRETAQKVELFSFNSAQQAVNLNRRDVVWIYRIVWASQ